MDQYYPSFLFHHPKFIFRTPEISVVRFQHKSAEIYFSQHEQNLVSLHASPFGGFLTDRELKKSDLQLCLEEMCEWCVTHRMASAMVRMFPDEYHPHFSSLIRDALLEYGFTILYTDIAQYIRIEIHGSMKLDMHKRRRLRNSETRGFQFRSLAPGDLDSCYDLFVQSRKNKGYPVTMSLAALKNVFTLFPGEYLLFGLFDDQRMIAASITIKVSDKIMYCFYIGDDLEYRSHSPVTALVSGIYDYCKMNNFSLLDLGISTEKGILNEGLFNFKKSFGALESPKLTFAKTIE